jgi:hypothetical protein
LGEKRLGVMARGEVNTLVVGMLGGARGKTPVQMRVVLTAPLAQIVAGSVTVQLVPSSTLPEHVEVRPPVSMLETAQPMP